MNPTIDSTFNHLTTEQRIGYFDKLDLLFETDATWTKQAGALDQDGFILRDPCDSYACRWCLIGGVYMITNQPDRKLHDQAHAEIMRCFRRALDKRGLHILAHKFNDTSSFDEVKALIAEARVEAMSYPECGVPPSHV